MRSHVLIAAHGEPVIRTRAALGALLAVFMTCGAAFAVDWPQWRGPNRDGISKETGLVNEWPKEGPKLLWQATDLENGYSTPAIAGGRLYVLSNKGTDNEFVQARDVKDGKEIWSTRIGKVGKPNQQPSYPAARSTPTVDGEVLYAFGSDGDLVCIEIDKGTVRWQKNLHADFQGKPGTWAYSESPLIDEDRVVCTPGVKRGDARIPLDKKTGELIWNMRGAGRRRSGILIGDSGRGGRRETGRPAFAKGPGRRRRDQRENFYGGATRSRSAGSTPISRRPSQATALFMRDRREPGEGRSNSMPREAASKQSRSISTRKCPQPSAAR